jgi:putative phosphoribosyl transferase
MVGEAVEQLVHIPTDGVQLEGVLALPPRAAGIVLFAHGSGSSRHSPRNIFVAQVLQRAGLGTLLLDLLSPAEDLAYRARFDIPRLAGRLIAATRWLQVQPAAAAASCGYFGASTGAAAALLAAAALGPTIRAIVSRGGRPDLAWDVLEDVRAPTLLLVGERDEAVLDLNRRAYARLRAPKQLIVIPGATHLFEEPGALPEVARLAADWFARHLPAQAAAG